MKPSRPENWQEAGFGLYLHWPFCKAKCPYCDFNSHVRLAVDQGAWLQAFLSELDRAAAETPGRVLRSVFFGGGTPSLMDGHVVAAILDRVSRNWSLSNDAEITLEANPTSSEAERFGVYRAAGVNRVSIGLQALDDIDLRRLGRQHSVDEALAAFSMARELFPRVSGDLIYARQNQSLDAWLHELSRLIALQPDHLSLYQLTIEEGTAFGALARAGKLRGLPDEDLAAEMYLATDQMCAEAGLQSYEVSNYALPGAESRHNMIYWNMGDYLGIGPGAHGRLSFGSRRLATQTHLSPETWIRSVQDESSGELPREVISHEAQADEYLAMALRLTAGASLQRHADLGGRGIAFRKLQDLQELGLVTLAGDRLRATQKGRLLLNQLILELSLD